MARASRSSAISSSIFAKTSDASVQSKPTRAAFFWAFLRAHQRGQRFGQSVENRGSLPFFGPLDLLPLANHFARVGGGLITKNMGMAPDQLLANLSGDGVESKGSPLARHLGMHGDMQQQIAQFFAQVCVVRIIDGIDQLVGFLEQRATNALVSLLDVPRTAIRRAQARHDLAQAHDRLERIGRSRPAHMRQSEMFSLPNSETSLSALRAM